MRIGRGRVSLARAIILSIAAAVLAGTAGCEIRRDENGRDRSAGREADERAGRPDVSVPAAGYADLDTSGIERQDADPTWWEYVQAVAMRADTAAGQRPPPDSAMGSTTSRGRSPQAAPPGGPALAPFDSSRAASVLRVQVLLDRSGFSPGVIDGRWGRNTRKALYWYQRAFELPSSGRIDDATWRALWEGSAADTAVVIAVVLDETMLAGPFVHIPKDVYEQAELDCLCYTSALERLAETYHTTERFLSSLNPGGAVDSLLPGARILVPNVTPMESPPTARATPAASPPSGRVGGADATIERLVVSRGGFAMIALGAGGRILRQFPATVGSRYDPSPDERLRITGIAWAPDFHYQPDLLDDVPDEKRDARLPPGPNSPVGNVWIALSKEHYGIHGTAQPRTIGYATSHGCVRLTNWDARFLAERVRSGVIVEFVR